MADQTPLDLRTRLEQLTPAELASLVIELVDNEWAAVPVGEEIYRRLTQPARSPAAPAIIWFQPAPPVHTPRRDTWPKRKLA